MFLILALLCGLGALMLYRMPVQRYVVMCERTAQVSCVLEQTTSEKTQRWNVPLAADVSAVVRVVPQRRGPPRILLYLESAAGAIFAAQFEGADAADAAESAAARLNGVFRGSAAGYARIEAAPPPYYRWLSWGVLGVMALIILAGFRGVQSRAAG